MRRAIAGMAASGCKEVALEAEATNPGALRLYEKLGFIRDKRLQRWAFLVHRLHPPYAGVCTANCDCVFVRNKQISASTRCRYYLNGNDAFRLKLLLPRPPPADVDTEAAAALSLLSIEPQQVVAT